jgi:hypothetical protein
VNIAVRAEVGLFHGPLLPYSAPSARSLPLRSRPLLQPHTSATAVLINELNAGDFDRSSNLFCSVFAPT